MIRPLHAAVAAFALFAASCTQLPKAPGGEVRSSGAALLEQRSPLEIVVAPVDGVAGTPCDDLRAGFQQALVARRYSPIALRYVDKKVVDASYKAGTLAEQAVFQTKVTRFDTSPFETNGAINVALTGKMVDANDGTVLWTGSVDRRYDFNSSREQYSTNAARMRAVCETIAAEVMEAMPARNPVPGYANG